MRNKVNALANAAKAPKQESKRTARQARKPKNESALEIIDRILMELVRITVGSEKRNVTTLEGIMEQLQAREFSGSIRAGRVLSKYGALQNFLNATSIEIEFCNNDDESGP